MMKNETYGQCKLCLKSGALCDSHFVPKAAYQIVRKIDNESPVAVDKELSVQTDRQIRGYILCPDCEDRFNKNGESWVMGNCFRGDGFKLKELIEGLRPKFAREGLSVYSAAEIPQIDIDKLTYFAASIIWRGSIF